MPDLSTRISELAPPLATQAAAPDRLVSPVLAELEADLVLAREPGGDDRVQLAERINRRVAALPRTGGRATADVLHRLLEDPALEDLADADGHTCRAAAAEALLGLGYPFALELSPEDLEHLKHERGFRTRQALRLGAVALVITVSGLEVVVRDFYWERVAFSHAGFTIASVLAASLARRGSITRGCGLAALIVAGALGLWIASLGAPAALLSGLAAWVAAALLLKSR